MEPSTRTLGDTSDPSALKGLPPDIRPVQHLARVLEGLSANGRGRRLLVATHKSPDPDAIGAMLGLGFLLQRAFGFEYQIATSGRIYRAENQTMVAELGVEFASLETIDPQEFCGMILVDTQPGFGHTLVRDDVPLVAVIDHHQPRTDVPPVDVPHNDVRLGVGASSALVYEYIRDAGLPLDTRTATSLCCGVRFDTADLSMHVTPLDQEAYFETFRAADRLMLARISRPPLPESYYRELHRSLSRARRYGPLVFGFFGHVGDPESVAEMADFFLRMEGVRWTVVGGEYEGLYHLSLRCEPGYAAAYPLLESILAGEGVFGGRGPIAGGQIDLAEAGIVGLNDLEKRLRERAIAQVDPSDLRGDESAYGSRLSQLD